MAFMETRLDFKNEYQFIPITQYGACIPSKIEKVPRGIQGGKSSKDMASSRNLVSTIGAQASPKKGGRNQVSGRVSIPWCLATHVTNAPWKPLIIRWR